MGSRKEKRRLAAATAFCFFFYFAQSLARNVYGTLSPFLVEHYHTSLSESSLFTMAENVGFIAVMLLVTVIADRLDKAWLMFGLSAVYGAVLLFMGTAPSLTLFLVTLVITGMLGRYMDTLCTAYISDLYGERRSSYMSWLLVIFYVGSTLAPNLNTLIIEGLGKPWNVTYLVCGTVMAGGAALFLADLLLLKKPVTATERIREKSSGGKVSVLDIVKNRNMAVLALSNILVAVSNYFTSQLILYLSMTDPAVYDTATRGFIATAGSLGLVVGSALFVWISRHMRAHRYLAMEMLITFAGSVLGLLINRPVPWMIIRFLSNAIGGGSFTARTLLCCEEFPTRSSSAIALVSLASGIASIFSTPLLNMLAEAVSFEFAMFLSLFFNLGSWALIRFGFRPHAPVPESA